MYLFAIEVSFLTCLNCEAIEHIYSDRGCVDAGISCVSDMGLKLGFNFKCFMTMHWCFTMGIKSTSACEIACLI
jgi:hypothetical protein